MSRSSAEPVENRPPISPTPRRSMAWVTLIGAVILVFFVVGGSLLWLLHSTPKLPPPLVKETAPAVTSTSPATVLPTWTPPEVTPPPESTFYDTFMNNQHGWSQAGESGFVRVLVDNMLILADTNPNSTLVESVPTSTNLSDYQVSVDFVLNRSDANDSFGLYLRGDGTLDHDYRVDINGNGTIDVAKEWLDSNQVPRTTMLFSPHPTSYLQPLGTPNTLTVIMLDSTLVVEVNNFMLVTLSDASYSNGQVALFAHHGNRSGGVIVSFTRVEIDRLASPQVLPTPTPARPPATGP